MIPQQRFSGFANNCSSFSFLHLIVKMNVSAYMLHHELLHLMVLSFSKVSHELFFKFSVISSPVFPCHINLRSESPLTSSMILLSHQFLIPTYIQHLNLFSILWRLNLSESSSLNALPKLNIGVSWLTLLKEAWASPPTLTVGESTVLYSGCSSSILISS